MKNIVLQWMGKNLFPLYIFQRLPMMLLNKITYMKENPYTFFAIAAVLTLLITFIYIAIMWIINKCKIKKINKNSITV